MTVHALRLEPYDRVTHYPLMVGWWKVRGDECLPMDVLPGTGAVVIRNNAVIAACFLYLMANARVGFLCFPITAPGLPSRVTVEAVTLAISGAADMAPLHGCRMVWSATGNKAIDRIMAKQTKFVRTAPLQNYFLMLDPNVSGDMLVS